MSGRADQWRSAMTLAMPQWEVGYESRVRVPCRGLYRGLYFASVSIIRGCSPHRRDSIGCRLLQRRRHRLSRDAVQCRRDAQTGGSDGRTTLGPFVAPPASEVAYQNRLILCCYPMAGRPRCLPGREL